MITFNAVLRSAGVDAAHVKLVRHQDTRLSGRPTPHQLWSSGGEGFELYQRIQKRAVFSGAKRIASFVATPLGDTLFVGLFAVNGCSTVPAGVRDPISGRDVEGLLLYDLTQVPALDDCRGRLVVDWGEGFRAWVQLARKRDKPVVEIRRTVQDPPFPGLVDFRERLSNLANVPHSWRHVLTSVGGIYLLVCPESGKQYVGSAHGAAGFWGRWMDYVASGHGGNRRMKEVPAGDYQVTILEIVSPNASPEEFFSKESRWKEKLLSRRVGLNAN
jgi:hypothetical protein